MSGEQSAPPQSADEARAWAARLIASLATPGGLTSTTNAYADRIEQGEVDYSPAVLALVLQILDGVLHRCFPDAERELFLGQFEVTADRYAYEILRRELDSDDDSGRP